VADKLASFDPASGIGSITWVRNQLAPRIAFSNMENVLKPFEGVTLPEHEYEINPSLPFSIQFVSPRTVRIRVKTGPQARPQYCSLNFVAQAVEPAEPRFISAFLAALDQR